jgi:ubiquinone/menaquinone biosynthesis C-methylase UbiE
MIASTNKHFNYESKCWGSAPITNFYTDFQGLELYWLLRDVIQMSEFRNKSSDIIRVLDLGCGGGNVCGFIKDRFPHWKVAGLDISKEAIGAAKQRFKGIEFFVSSAETIKKQDESYDLITSFDTLEHFEQLDGVLGEVYRLLKPGGVFCVGVPLEREFPTIYWLLYTFGWRGKKHFSGHVNFFTDKSLVTTLRRHGFVLKKKRFSFHFIFSLFDVGYYFLQSISGKQFAFETSVSEMKPGMSQFLLSLLKRLISFLGYFESRLFWYLPGGKGHFIFIKK